MSPANLCCKFELKGGDANVMRSNQKKGRGLDKVNMWSKENSQEKLHLFSASEFCFVKLLIHFLEIYLLIYLKVRITEKVRLRDIFPPLMALPRKVQWPGVGIG